MKALVYQGPGRKALEERPIPEINTATDAIVKIVKTTICGTDLPEQRPEAALWPFNWFGDAASAAWRTFFPFQSLEQKAPPAQRSQSAARGRLQSDAPDGIDPPTSIDRLLQPSMARFTIGLSPAALGLIQYAPTTSESARNRC